MANYNNQTMRTPENVTNLFFRLDGHVADRAKAVPLRMTLRDASSDHECGRGGIAVEKILNCDAEWQATLSRISGIKVLHYGNVKKLVTFITSRDVTSPGERNGVRVVTAKQYRRWHRRESELGNRGPRGQKPDGTQKRSDCARDFPN